MPRLLLLASLAASAAAHGSGVWKDPNHYISDSSLAGLRFVSEFPPHVLNLVGTDDGKTWWALSGTCSGPAMTEINIDFSPKGGPGAVTGTWAKSGGVESITFPDGNTWVLAEKPTWAIAAPDGVDDHVGIFRDPNHFVSPKSWAGLRFIAEFPPHELRMVGSDDGNVRGMWFLAGSCTGAGLRTGGFGFCTQYEAACGLYSLLNVVSMRCSRAACSFFQPSASKREERTTPTLAALRSRAAACAATSILALFIAAACFASRASFRCAAVSACFTGPGSPPRAGLPDPNSADGDSGRTEADLAGAAISKFLLRCA